MKVIEGHKKLPVILGSQERNMLGALAEQDDRSMGAVIRILIRTEYLRRKAARYEEQSAQMEVTR
jgi:hypothetical protein